MCPQQDRQIYAETGKQIFRGTGFDTGLTEQQWNTGWGLMAQDKNYNVPLYGDLMFMSTYLQNIKKIQSRIN
jgi:hypothetical protein